MEDEIFEMDEFAVDPQRCAGVGEILPFEETGTDPSAFYALVEPRQSDVGDQSRPHQVTNPDFLDVYTIDFMVNIALTKAKIGY